ncbi:flagellar M-ring protein FliF C-terminal domain-containing protein, partial [Enterococcus faecium]|uniref:flagellar M-ring protein FliF C-terminal domain-containing protein n=1 Tax=Enterococcus faecium TaxID=1352 RepID=UPI002AD4B05E
PIYGADKFQVSINLDLNFDSIERKKVTYADPEIKSETVQAAGSQGTVQEAQTGTVDDNVSNVTGTDGEGNNSYSRSVENELDTETTTTITAPGMIERMTSSIVINANLSQADQAELQQLIASAVGYDNDRGDQIAIQGFDFAQAEVD